MFRFHKSVPVPYDRQGYIYFSAKRYKFLPEREKEKIRAVCQEAGGEYGKALLEYMTTDAEPAAVCRRHYISRSTLDRMVRRYYITMDQVDG